MRILENSFKTPLAKAMGLNQVPLALTLQVVDVTHVKAWFVRKTFHSWVICV